MTRAIMIAAPRSGGGKTTTTLGLLAALRGRNIAAQAAKTGPDYIDPAFHEVVTGRSSLNLDSWAMTPSLLETMLARSAEGADLLVVESAMGLFDGLLGPEKSRGAPSDIAARFDIPVVLVLDISGQGQSAAAIAHGFSTLDPDVRVAGVVLNQVASPRHLSMAREAVLAAGIPVLGAFMRDPFLKLPERHLGLVQAREQATLEELLQRLQSRAEESLDLDNLLQAASPMNAQDRGELAVLPPGQRVAIADDAAFSFLYGHVAKSWRQAGAELIPFSPLANEGPDESCDACWLPGGYPELHAGSLAAADQFINRLAAFSRTRPVHGECGGFMVLGRTLEDADGIIHQMTGLLSHETSFAKRKMNLGYREAILQTDCALGTKGAVFRGHEFHYARVTNPGTDSALALLRDGNGNDLGSAGGYRGHVSGSFFHVMAGRGRDAI